MTQIEQFGKNIRQQNGMYSIFDIIRECGQRNPRDSWKRLCDGYPEIKEKCACFKFPGPGQRNTPVACLEVIEEILHILNIHPNKETITSDKFFPRTEAQIISVLEVAFKDLQPNTQFYCAGYRIDLYLSRIRLAIECDEHGHKSYNHKQERIREREIKKTLGCSFLRFDPYSEDFNIGDVIFKIRELS